MHNLEQKLITNTTTQQHTKGQTDVDRNLNVSTLSLGMLKMTSHESISTTLNAHFKKRATLDGNTIQTS